MPELSDSVRLPSGKTACLQAVTARIIRIEQSSETVIAGSGGGGKIREKWSWLNDRYEVRGDIAPVQINSHTIQRQLVWYRLDFNGQEGHFEVLSGEPLGLEGHPLLLASGTCGAPEGQQDLLYAENLHLRKVLFRWPLLQAETTVGAIWKKAIFILLIAAAGLRLILPETIWMVVMAIAAGLIGFHAYTATKEVEQTNEDEAAVTAAITRLAHELLGGSVSLRNNQTTPAGSHAGTALLR